MGDRVPAENEIKQALQLSPGETRVMYRAVSTYQVLGLRREQLSVLSNAPLQILTEMKSDPFLADLTKDSSFQKLVADKSQKR